MQIFNDDCFNVFSTIKPKSVDLVLVDLPYNQTHCKWDKDVIDLEQMWKELKRCCTKKCLYVFFTTTKFGVSLINSNPKWFKYDLVWEKSKKVGFLSANKMPLRKHEMVYVFGNKSGGAKTYHAQKVKGKPYTHQGRLTAGSYGLDIKPIPTINTGDRHPDSLLQFEEPSHEMVYVFASKTGGPKTYNPQKVKGKPYVDNRTVKNKLDVYDIEKQKVKKVVNDGSRHPDSVLTFDEPTHEMVYVFASKTSGPKTYNPQKTKGKPYTNTQGKQTDLYGITGNMKTINIGDRHPTSIIKYITPEKPKMRGAVNGDGCYREFKNTRSIDDGSRHPTTILQFKNPHRPKHRTQKPVLLCEWLIKSYSNEGDLVLDFTAGSGSTGIACKNTNRKCILIEKDLDIFNILKDRIGSS